MTGVGAFLAIYLAGFKWNEQSVGLALTVGGIAGIVMQTPGSIVHRFGYNAGFLFLAGVAAVALGILYFFMPETGEQQFPNPVLNPALGEQAI